MKIQVFKNLVSCKNQVVIIIIIFISGGYFFQNGTKYLNTTLNSTQEKYILCQFVNMFTVVKTVMSRKKAQNVFYLMAPLLFF